MPEEGRKSLTVLDKVHQIAAKRHEDEVKAQKTNLSFTKWVSEYLLMNLERDEFLRIYSPSLEKIGIHNNRITIRDNKLDKLTDVFLKDEEFFCSLDETDDCIHIHFALALPELGRLKKKG